MFTSTDTYGASTTPSVDQAPERCLGDPAAFLDVRDDLLQGQGRGRILDVNGVSIEKAVGGFGIHDRKEKTYRQDASAPVHNVHAETLKQTRANL